MKGSWASRGNVRLGKDNWKSRFECICIFRYEITHAHGMNGTFICLFFPFFGALHPFEERLLGIKASDDISGLAARDGKGLSI